MRWLVADHPGPLEDAFPTLRMLLLRSVGVPEARIAALAAESVAMTAVVPDAATRRQHGRRCPAG